MTTTAIPSSRKTRRVTPAQASEMAVHIQIRKSGYKELDRVVNLDKLTEDETSLWTSLEEKLTVLAAP